MKKSRRTRPGRDCGSAFLVLILIGIIVVVLGLMMAMSHATARLPAALERAEQGVSHQVRSVAPHRIYH